MNISYNQHKYLYSISQKTHIKSFIYKCYFLNFEVIIKNLLRIKLRSELFSPIK